MPIQNLVNFISGELSPKLRARSDLGLFQKGVERMQNFIAEIQGSARFRPGFVFVNHTRANQPAVLIPFQFNDQQAYLIEATGGFFRFYKNNGVITEGNISITGVSQASPGVVTANAHGYSNGDEVFISGIIGMTQLNGPSYIVENVTTNTFTLTDVYGNAINTSGFTAYTSGGIANRIYQITTPYVAADLETLQYAQNADTMYIVNQNYQPLKLTRSGNTSWTLAAFSRTSDPFSTGGNYPACVRFYEGRLWYANTLNAPQTFWGSRGPTTAGVARYDDFTVPSTPLANDAVIFTTAQNNGQVDNIQWMAGTNRVLVFGNYTSLSEVYGASEGSPIEPTAITVKPLPTVGCARALPFSDGSNVFFIQRNTLGIQSVGYNFIEDSYDPYDRSEAADHLALPGLKRMIYQTGKPNVIWSVRNDGVLLGLSYKDADTEPGWHQHRIGGNGLVLSAGILPRPTATDQLWIVAQRTINGNTVTSVEYMSDEVLFPDPVEFYTGQLNQVSDTQLYNNYIYELQKTYNFLDMSLTYDGSAYGTNTGANLTPGTGATVAGSTGVIFTASAAVFDSTMVGREIWKRYDSSGNGGGRMLITGFTSSTVVTGTIEVAFDVLTAMTAGGWFLTTSTISGLSFLNGQTVGVVGDGAPQNSKTVSNGSVTLDSASSVVTVGLNYIGIIKTMNLGAPSQNGSTQTEEKNITQICFRFLHTLGIMVGTALYALDNVIFRQSNDYLNRPVPVFSGVYVKNLQDKYDREKSVIIVQENPLPCNVQGIDVYVDTVGEE